MPRKDRAKQREYERRYAEKNRDKLNAYAREYYKANKDKRKDTMLRSRYGIGLDDKQTMIAAQGHKCSVCLAEIDMDTGNVDHCHMTGRVRGVLCNACNTALGLFKDNTAALARAIEYLGDSRGNSGAEVQ